MRLTIIPIDKNVGVNNKFINGLDLSQCNIPSNIHALQWYEDNGEIEFIDNADRTKPMNEVIFELPLWAINCIDIYEKSVIVMSKEINLVQPVVNGIVEA